MLDLGEIDWEAFKRWLEERFSKKQVEIAYYYARKYGCLLSGGGLSRLQDLSSSVRKHVLVALANLSKYLGCYQHFRQLREASGLKWEKTPAIQRY
ncbi:MAG: hypothetical protein ACXQTF_04730 [Candidatus Hecatellaceae archaeon]